MPFPFLAMAGIGAGMTALGMVGQNRALRSGQANARQFMTMGQRYQGQDTSEIEGALRGINGQNNHAIATREALNAGFGFNMSNFNQQNAIRGAGRNTYGSLLRAGRDAGQMQFGSAVMGRLGQLQQGQNQQRVGLLGLLNTARGNNENNRMSLYGMASGLQQQNTQQQSNMWSGLADLGGAIGGMGARGWMQGQIPDLAR